MDPTGLAREILTAIGVSTALMLSLAGAFGREGGLFVGSSIMWAVAALSAWPVAGAVFLLVSLLHLLLARTFASFARPRWFARGYVIVLAGLFAFPPVRQWAEPDGAIWVVLCMIAVVAFWPLTQGERRRAQPRHAWA